MKTEILTLRLGIPIIQDFLREVCKTYKVELEAEPGREEIWYTERFFVKAFGNKFPVFVKVRKIPEMGFVLNVTCSSYLNKDTRQHLHSEFLSLLI